MFRVHLRLSSHQFCGIMQISRVLGGHSATGILNPLQEIKTPYNCKHCGLLNTKCNFENFFLEILFLFIQKCRKCAILSNKVIKVLIITIMTVMAQGVRVLSSKR